MSNLRKTVIPSACEMGKDWISILLCDIILSSFLEREGRPITTEPGTDSFGEGLTVTKPERKPFRTGNNRADFPRMIMGNDRGKA